MDSIWDHAVHWCMVLIATGSPLIRIMVKSIAGIAWGPVHASVYTSEVKSPVLTQSSHLLKENRDSLQWEDCGAKPEGTDWDKGGKHWDGWRIGRFSVIKRLFFKFLEKAPIYQASRAQLWLNNLPTLNRSRSSKSSDPTVLRSSRFIPSAPLPLDPFISPRNHLGLQGSGGVSTLPVSPVGRRERQSESKCKFTCLIRGFRLNAQHKTVTVRELTLSRSRLN